MHTCQSIRTYVHAYMSEYRYMHTCQSIGTYMHTCQSTRTCIHVRVYVRTYMHTCESTGTCIHVRVYVRTYMHTCESTGTCSTCVWTILYSGKFRGINFYKSEVKVTFTLFNFMVAAWIFKYVFCNFSISFTGIL